MIQFSDEFKVGGMTGYLTFLGQGAGSARIQLYGGTRPAFKAAPGSAMLGEITLQEPCGTVGATGTLTLLASADAMVTATGTATWARIINGDDVIAWDCDVSDMAGSAEIRLNSTTLYIGGNTALASGTLG